MKRALTLDIKKEDVVISKGELARRLSSRVTEIDYALSLLPKLLTEITPRVAYRRVSIERKEGFIDLGFSKTDSRDIQKCLSNYNEALLISVTLGPRVDKLILRESMLSPASAFTIDALASAYAEGLIQLAEDILTASTLHSNRFSIGYGDLPLSLQGDFLEFLSAESTLGITLSDAFIMSPMKSITAIVGVLSEKGEKNERN